MLFNSQIFVLLFLPITWVGYQLLCGAGRARAALAWLVLASLVYYGFWNPAYVALILGSCAFNFWVGRGLSADARARKATLALGISANLLLLGYFKYTNFLVSNMNLVGGLGLDVAHVVLPIGISFFTFQQVAYLMDIYRGQIVDRDPVRYALFVTFFPQLIAGPIVHHSETMPQFARPQARWRENLGIGLTIFALGLTKKVMLADRFAVGASGIYDAAAGGAAPGFADALTGTLCYTLQIYFDFSGYSDMAIGLGRMFGIVLPVNFASPYKAASMIDFWRRWHITLSRFLRDYLYFPLGGNRRGEGRRYANVFLTMFLGGIWHGAGWNFALWGALHGSLIVANHLWRDFGPSWRVPRAAGQAATFVLVMLAWVPFRAADLATTGQIYRSLLGGHGFFGPAGVPLVNETALLLLPLGLLIVFALPATHEFMARIGPALSSPGYPATESTPPGRWAWRPRVAYALFAALILSVSILHLNDVSEFIYFQF